MRFRNVTREQLIDALDTTSRLHYAGNLRWNRGPDKRGNAFIGTIRAFDSHLPGARLAANGHRSVGASWHAHRDFFRLLLTIAPQGIIETGLYGAVRYEGLDDFEKKHPDTYNLPVHGCGTVSAIGDLSVMEES